MTISYPSPKKVSIIGMEIDVDLVAQYNPKEVQIEKSADWKPHPTAKSNSADLEYTSSPGRTLTMELLFDTYEENEDVGEKYVSKLMQLINVMDPDGDEMRKRPSVVQVRWPDRSYATFEGVIQSLSTKYTMFATEGKPVRATCTVKILEAPRKWDPAPSRIAAKRITGW
jgi:hypothetical protein